MTPEEETLSHLRRLLPKWTVLFLIDRGEHEAGRLFDVYTFNPAPRSPLAVCLNRHIAEAGLFLAVQVAGRERLLVPFDEDQTAVLVTALSFKLWGIVRAYHVHTLL
jgi:hypothetical protein